MIARFIQTIRFLLKNGGTWCDGAEWNAEDAQRLSTFLRTATGQKFSARLRNSSLSMNANAVQTGEPHRCGTAAGYLLAVTDIQTLAAEGAPEDAQTSEEGLSTGEANLEHLSP